MSEHDPEASPEPRPSRIDPVASTAAPTPVHEPPLIEHAPPPPPPPPPPPSIEPARPRGGTPLPLTLLLVAALGGAGYWTWMHPPPNNQSGAPSADPGPAIEAARAQLAQQIQALSGRVDALEKQPPQAGPPPADAADAGKIDALAARVDALEKQSVPAAGASAGDAAATLSKKLDDLTGRVDSLSAKQDQLAAEAAKQAEIAAQKAPVSPEPSPDHTAQDVPNLIAQQQAADLGKLTDSVTQQKSAVEQAQADAKSAQDALTAQKAALDQLTQRLSRLEQDAGQAQTQAQAQATDTASIAALDTRVGKLEHSEGQAEGAVTGAAKDATRAIRIEAAEAALQAGQPLGDLPGAPPALTRYAASPPPTESALRAEFPRVAANARAVSQPDVARKSFLQRMFARVQQSVVVRQGDQVIVGDPAAGVLARAQDHMAAGDLKGAADTLAELRGPAADAVKSWVDQVHALLDARAALATLAARG